MNTGNIAVEELLAEMERAEVLASKDKLTPAEERQFTRSTQNIKLLAQGVTGQEIARARVAKLNKELGIEQAGITIPRNAVEEWRGFLLGDGWKVSRRDHIGNASQMSCEMRVDLQSTSQWGRPTGQSYDGPTSSTALIPASFYADRLFSQLTDYDEILDADACTVWESDKGSAGPVPYINDVSGSPVSFNRASKVDESVQSTTVPTKAGALEFGKTPTWRTGKIQVALELEMDSDLFAANVQMVEAIFAQRTALAVGADAAANILSNIGAAYNVTSNSSSALAVADLISLYYALPHIYRRNAVIACSDSVAKQITLAYEAAARTLVGPIEEVLRRTIKTCPSFPTFAAGNVGAVIYAKDRLIQRRVKNGTFVRRYKEAGGVEYGLTVVEGFSRVEVQPLNFNDANFPPCAVLNIHS